MSWIQDLFKTYENCKSKVGIYPDNNRVPLLPLCHTTQKAQIEIAIDQDGNYCWARPVEKDDARTIIPCTEGSGGRASGEAPHPLCDKLQYVAADYKDYNGKKKPYFKGYLQQLGAWCESEYSHPKANAVLKYVERGNVVKDLIEHGVEFDIEGFVRWIVQITGDPQTSVWTDLSLFQSWTNYYSAIKEGKALCYVTGKEVPQAEQHPRNIRRDGDSAKLISSNDISGFTFRGRFSSAEEACSIGMEVTQKAHSALRWLISRQGYRYGESAIVAWATTGEAIPAFLSDAYALYGMDDPISESTMQQVAYTAQELALKLKARIAGYSAELGDTTDIVVMGLDSATPGRMSITFYRKLTGSDFLKRVENWHNSCCWIHDYLRKEVTDGKTGKIKKVAVRFVGAPAPNDIAEAAFGKRLDDKLRKATVERLLPCIVDGRPIPIDLVESTVRRASNRVGLEDYEWNKTLSIACALYRKYYEKEGLGMSLDENRKTRDYLYGRLLALADNLEEWALNKAEEKRQTNAARLMQRFADHPYSTWRIIELGLGPYKARLGGRAWSRQKLISEVMTMFEPEDFVNDKKLKGEFLLGYHCQLEALRKKDQDNSNEPKSTDGDGPIAEK